MEEQERKELRDMLSAQRQNVRDLLDEIEAALESDDEEQMMRALSECSQWTVPNIKVIEVASVGGEDFAIFTLKNGIHLSVTPWDDHISVDTSVDPDPDSIGLLVQHRRDELVPGTEVDDVSVRAWRKTPK